ncbi:MAG: hypothetical protein PVJ03_09390 [Chromatiaceae bacterium]|jgi:hypothetical protein
MAESGTPVSKRSPGAKTPSEEFSAFCETEFEHRLNSGQEFDEGLYRKARDMVIDRLIRLEREER